MYLLIDKVIVCIWGNEKYKILNFKHTINSVMSAITHQLHL